ncbi:MAG: hypothetical protein ABJ382_03600, partial [Ilumatobacter sp.]
MSDSEPATTQSDAVPDPDVDVSPSELIEQAVAWLEAEPDDDIRRELTTLVDAARTDNADALADLADRFSGRLQFGTAGLRAAVAAGPMRMNR